MKRYLFPCLLLASVIFFSGCSNYATNKLKRQMKSLAKEYLKSMEISDYDELTVECVDTLTELGYAKLTTELLTNMQQAYQMQLGETTDDATTTELLVNLSEISSVADELEERIDNGDLKTSGVLLYMVTGSMVDKNKEKQEFMFLANPDKKSLHNLDPFGNNLLHDEQ